MRSVKSFVVAAVALLPTTVFAADVPIAPPPYAPPPAYAPPVEDFGGWYLRGDIGVSQQKVKSLYNVLYDEPGVGVQTVGKGFGGAAFFGVGVGYQFNSWLRADVTGEYRMKSSIHGLDIVSFNGGVIGTDEYRGNKEEWVALVNLYADLGTWWCITPFVGVGVGGARTTISSFVDVNTPNLGVAFAHDESKWGFAYALHAGLGYKVTNNLTMELAYRYLHLGDAHSGDLRTFDGTNNVNNPMHFRDISSHDIKLGVRWTCCEPEAPPPPPVLMRRG
ncbi:outer membrane beta-barrel protein [Bradyrhizobium sp. LHD-71]|uniref:outer membrane protein n=1 Tax=Bradyrhizobium sp. LHD-71 TaxID=3072141 RepID=UPI00280C8F85|nr:outer membrane beta-barrel protein [Bradyrhizobium sp. LHD-71]MDQ8726823.1 outer membrane beta-barrel protein [Bradyrhizobium sp. LHD-71]